MIDKVEDQYICTKCGGELFKVYYEKFNTIIMCVFCGETDES